MIAVEPASVRPFFLSCFDRIHFILAGNDDIHKSLDEFKIWPDPTSDHRVTCPLVSEKSMLPLFLGCFSSNPFHTYR